jgi:hypothetical protein
LIGWGQGPKNKRGIIPKLPGAAMDFAGSAPLRKRPSIIQALYCRPNH